MFNKKTDDLKKINKATNKHYYNEKQSRHLGDYQRTEELEKEQKHLAGRIIEVRNKLKKSLEFFCVPWNVDR